MQLFSISIQLGIMKIYTLFFHDVLFDWLNVWMHLSARLWVSCFMPYLSFIFKESLSFSNHTDARSQRGAQTHASVTHHMVSCHTAGILHNGSKRLYLSTCVSPHVQVWKRKDLQTKEAWPSSAERWQGCAEAQRRSLRPILQLWYLQDRDMCLTQADTDICLHHQWIGLPIPIVVLSVYSFYIWFLCTSEICFLGKPVLLIVALK